MRSLTCIRTIRFALANQKIPRPRDPTLEESFETKIPEEQMKILIDPKGFMSEEERIREQKNQPHSDQKINNQISKVYIDKNTGKPMQPEYGLKPKGPQPTRYGDWEIKGKCVDF